MSFYEYMMAYPHKTPERKAFAKELKWMAQNDERYKHIDSLSDYMIVTLDDPFLCEALSPHLWFEYCTICGHPLTEG